MPRRRPAQVRAQLPFRRPPPVRQIPRVSALTTRCVAELERARFRTGRTAEALEGWARFVRGPSAAIARYRIELNPCPCCDDDDPAVGRAFLRTVLNTLPAKAARELLELVRPLDRLYLARSSPTPEHAELRALLTCR
ncbi:hypothetical protein GCM10022267_23490 [Lentzea roselyniae]|uniref:Uncharacterized protein n=1 Tax=Lentzea roselyniae TaxID=531940 RepID=A0ABP7AN48_9PSEU